MSYTVLIVDDEKTIRDGLYKIVKWDELGFEVAGLAANGLEALSFIKNTACPDVILTDIRMPNMDGLQLIEEIRKTDHKIEFIILSGYDYFDYARKAVELGAFDFILKPTKIPELKSKFLRLKEKLDMDSKKKIVFDQGLKLITENCIMNVLYDNYNDLNQIIYELQLEPECANEYCITAAALKIFDIKDERFLLELQEEINEVMGNLYFYYSVFDRKGILVFILMDRLGSSYNSDNSNKSSTAELFISEIKAILVKGGYKFAIGKGEKLKGINHVCHSYRQALKALDISFFRGFGNAIIYSSWMDGFSALKYPQEFDKKLILAVESMSKVHSACIINELFENFFMDEHLNPDNIFNMCIEIIIVISRHFENLETKTGNAFGENVVINKKVSDFYTIEQLKEWFRKCIFSIIDMLKDIKSNNSSRIVSHIKKTVDIRYNEQITLASIADSLYMNPDYLSRLFKKETGMSFVEYLTYFRVEKAKKLLSDVLIKSYEVGFMVGYQDPNYFAKIFKKIAGQSVSEYRKLISK